MSLFACSAPIIKCPKPPVKIDVTNKALTLAELQAATVLKLEYDRDIDNGCQP